MYNKDKIVIFDWGGVIESHYENEYNGNLATLNVIKHFSTIANEEEIINRYLSFDYEDSNKNIHTCSKIEDAEKWFNRLKNEFDFKCGLEEFCEVYQEEFSKVDYYKNVVSLAHSLKEYCNIGILSNLIWLDKNRIDNQMNLNKFDYVWLSFEIGYMKPDEKIYDFVEKDCKIAPNNILFIDDTEKNIIAAEKRGWNACLANGHEIDKMKDVIYKFLND